MKLKHYLVVLVYFLSYSCYLHSEIINGHTSNASSTGLNWVMTNVLPAQTGLTVGSVSYRYTTVKETIDPMVVNVQNQNALGTGYIFRSTDDWTGRPQNTITKTVPTDSIPIQYWGDGEIKVEGKGLVVNPSVIYNYRYDTCFGTYSSDPKCPNYKPNIPEIKVTDPLDDEFVKKSLDNKPTLETEEERERNNRFLRNAQQDDKRKSNIVTKTIQNSLVTAEAAAQATKLESLNIIPASYTVAIPGGVYKDTIKLPDKIIPDNRKGLRMNLSQQQLHNRMIDSQYNRGLTDD